MSTLEIILRTIAGLTLLAANGFFVTSEFAMTRVPQFDKSEFMESSGLRKAWEMTEALEIYLTACQVGITITSILLGVVFEPAVSALIHPAVAAVGLPSAYVPVVSIILSVALIQLMHTVWAEQTPTYLGVELPKSVAAYCAFPLSWWTNAMYPFIYVGDHLAKATLGVFGIEMGRSWTEETAEIETRTDLRKQMGALLSRGRVSGEYRKEIINALEIIDMPTREIMVPREDIVALSTQNGPEENFRLLREAHHARFPLIGESMEDYRGIVYVPSLFPFLDKLQTGEVTFEEIAVAPMTVSSQCPVSDLIDRFQAEHQELAFVMEAGEVVGLVTSTDAFEEVLGELEDPFD